MNKVQPMATYFSLIDQNKIGVLEMAYKSLIRIFHSIDLPPNDKYTSKLAITMPLKVISIIFPNIGIRNVGEAVKSLNCIRPFHSSMNKSKNS